MPGQNFSQVREELLRRTRPRSQGGPYSQTIIGVGWGPKERNEQLTNEISGRVYVTSKAPRGVLNPNHESFIPPDLAGMPTDVVEIGRVRPFTSNATPGDYIGLPLSSDFGSLGAVVRETQTGAAGFITCNHVIALNGHVAAGAPINVYLPGPAVGVPAFRGMLKGFKRLQHDENNYADCAYALFEHQDRFEQTFGDLNPVSSTVEDAILGEKVVRLGGSTPGTIVDVSLALWVDYPFGTFYLADQIVIRTDPGQPRFAADGDSGGIVMRERNGTHIPIAMIWGGKRNLTFACPLRYCLDEMKLIWVGPSAWPADSAGSRV